MKSFTVCALEDFPLINSGDDLAEITIEIATKNGIAFEDGDIIVIAQKVFSKAENRVFKLKDITPSRKAEEIAKSIGKNPRFVELVLAETKRILKISRDILLVEDKRGLVCINAGIDKSNIRGLDNFVLLPENPDASAEKYHARIKELTGKNIGVVICDTYSRPFRRGQVNFAIGLAGIKPFKDYRGKKDLFGQLLKVKNIAVVDEIACAAELLMGQATEATPVVILRGLKEALALAGKSSTRDLQIPSAEDLFKNTL